jgi:hypothetical protein
MLARLEYIQLSLVHQSPFEVEIAIEKSKRHKLPGTGQIGPELIQALRYVPRSVNLLILFGMRKNFRLN